MTQKEMLFGHAITLAAAFVANGDIRLGGSTREDSTAMAMLGDLIDSLYQKLEEEYLGQPGATEL